MEDERFFILNDEKGALPCIRDKEFRIDDIYGHREYDNLEEICNELNSLVNECNEIGYHYNMLSYKHQSLRKENRDLKTKLGCLSRVEQDNEILKEENRKLKEDIIKACKESYDLSCDCSECVCERCVMEVVK